MVMPSLSEARAIDANTYKMIPLCEELYADIITPVEVIRKLKTSSKHCFMLESVESSKNWGRYTFIGFDPKLLITCLDGTVRIVSSQGEEVFESADPNAHIQGILDQHKSAKVEGLPPFTGGLVGYFAYDYAKYSEDSLKLDAHDEENFNDVDLMLFDKIIAFDNLRQKIALIVNIDSTDIENSYQAGLEEIDQLKTLIENKAESESFPGKICSEFEPLFTKDEFCSMVEKTKGHIVEGDIFQVVLSNRWKADFEGSIFDAYRYLRTSNPSPYMFYFSGSDVEIAGASPETLVKLHDGRLSTFPLAGTRPRGETPKEDARLAQELLEDEKELAEHNMLVDLGRNDLGKISKFGSVAVEDYLSLLRFSHVMHIGSTVVGELQDGKTGLDAINAVLPAGTLSGAPKIKAMQIINELEDNHRGIYGGAIGYLDFTGNMDTCIAIRIAYKKGDKVYLRSGAGIVADSDPESEYYECIHKSKAIVESLEQLEGGLS